MTIHTHLGQGTGKLWIALSYLALVVFIGLTIMYNLKSVAHGTAFRQEYASKDIALLIETLSYAPGKASYTYPLDTSFSYSITEGRVTVRKDTTHMYPFTQDLTVPLSARQDNEKLIITKER